MYLAAEFLGLSSLLHLLCIELFCVESLLCRYLPSNYGSGPPSAKVYQGCIVVVDSVDLCNNDVLQCSMCSMLVYTAL